MNIGQAMDPKSGQFVTPEPGLYLFLITCCTFDMKKCLVSIRKNGKDVANLFDQDGDTNKVFFKSIYKKMGIHYGNTGCRVFKRGVQNWKKNCLKINIPKGNY